MSDQDEKVVQFTSITGATEDRAKFFLESSAWQVEVALARYYENEGEDVEVVETTPSPQVQGTTESKATAGSKPKSKPRSTSFATFNTITTSSDEEEEGQAYYAGGSEHSGQQVLGPPKKRDIVDDMFKSVQEHGVEILDPSSSSTSRAFRGTGYKLGQDKDDSVVIPGAVAPPRPSEVTLRLWQNGFSLNDGDLREYSDPANRDFLDSIRRGEIPQELRQGNTEVHLAMEDHRMEAYKKMENRTVRPFQGQGYTLGSPAPTVLGATCDEDKPANEAKAKDNLKLDSSRPTTNIQIRLADGSRLVGQFNSQHTVGEVRSYIIDARPQYQSLPFNLLSSYPSKVLDEAQTLEEAGLLNAAIMQKLI